MAIIVTDLSLTFYPGNSTLEFELSAASTKDDLNVSVGLDVNAYGLGVFNVNLNLCDIAGGILCPLPQYQFSGGGIYPVPTQFAGEIPGIAYTVPDLEAVATVELTDINTNEVVGCVQATLDNGHTTQQPAVLWATVGFALLALFSSLLHSAIAQSTGAAQWRIVDVMLAIQHPAITSLLTLNYPVAFLSYGLNFAWSIGLVNIPSLQRSITKTRRNTGGNHGATFGTTLVAESGRKYNPFSESTPTPSTGGKSIDGGALGLNLRRGMELLSRSSDYTPGMALSPIDSHVHVHNLAKRQMYAPNTGPGGSLLTGGSNVELPIVTQNETSNGDIGTFAERLYIAPDNSFLTVLVSMFILLAIVIGALLLVYVVALLLRALTIKRHGKLSDNVNHWSHRIMRPKEFLGSLSLAMFGRYFLIIFPPFFIFAFYQWDHGDSWVGHLVAAIFFVIVLALAGLLFYPMIKYARRGSPTDLYYNNTPPAHGSELAKRWGAMAHPFRPKYYWFAAAFCAWSILRACFVSFAQGYGTRQAIGLLVLEVLLFVVLCFLRVGRDKKSDFVFIFLCFSRIAAWAVCIAFIPAANVTTIPRVIVGFVLIVVTGLPIIYLFFLTLYDLFTPLLKRNRKDVQHEKDAEGEPQMSEYSYGNVGTGQEQTTTPPSEANGSHEKAPEEGHQRNDSNAPLTNNQQVPASHTLASMATATTNNHETSQL